MDCSNRLRNNRGKLKNADDHLASWAIDETGTVDTTLLLNIKENEEQLSDTEQLEKRRVQEAGVLDKVLKIHGIAPAS